MKKASTSTRGPSHKPNFVCLREGNFKSSRERKSKKADADEKRKKDRSFNRVMKGNAPVQLSRANKQKKVNSGHKRKRSIGNS